MIEISVGWYRPTGWCRSWFLSANWYSPGGGFTSWMTIVGFQLTLTMGWE